MHTATQIVAQIFVGFLIGAIVWPPLTNLFRVWRKADRRLANWLEKPWKA